MTDIVSEKASVVVDKNEIKVTPNTSTPSVETEEKKVTVSPNSYHIVSQDIYTIKKNSEPDSWFKSLMENAIDTSTLANDVGNLSNQFDNFKDGVNLEIGYLKSVDSSLAYDISTIKTTLDSNNAAIQNLDVTKVTKDEARAVSQNTIASWQSEGGGAWFDKKISTVSNVAYSAAKSTSTLTASIDSQQDQLNSIVGDIDTLQSQVDGKVETWTGEQAIVDGNGDLIETAEPYASWLSANDIARHTGDTFVRTEIDPATGKPTILATYRFAGEGENPIVYNWYIFQDDLASLAYQQAIDAGVLADSKITTFYQTYPPTTVENPTLHEGDLWLDSDDGNKMWRYQGNPLDWALVEDTRITASVNRLDEATVNVDGSARAKSSLSVDANGIISGFVAESDGSTSNFSIFADKFSITNSANGSDAGNPFTVDTATNKIEFNGTVSFKGTPADSALQPGDAANDINTGITEINGGKIKTNSLNANALVGNTVWTDGSLRSADYNTNSPYTSGFLLDSNPSSDRPNIYGAYIKGGTIDGVDMTSTSLRFNNLKLVTDAGKEAIANPNSFNGKSLYPFDANIDSKNRTVARSQEFNFSGVQDSDYLPSPYRRIGFFSHYVPSHGQYGSIGMRLWFGSTYYDLSSLRGSEGGQIIYKTINGVKFGGYTVKNSFGGSFFYGCSVFIANYSIITGSGDNPLSTSLYMVRPKGSGYDFDNPYWGPLVPLENVSTLNI